MRVALFTRLPEIAVFYDARLRELGHDCVGVVTAHGPEGRYGGEPLGALVDAAPRNLDVLVASTPARFAPLLAALQADVAVSGGFPLRIPPRRCGCLAWSRQRPSVAAAAAAEPDRLGAAQRRARDGTRRSA